MEKISRKNFRQNFWYLFITALPESFVLSILAFLLLLIQVKTVYYAITGAIVLFAFVLMSLVSSKDFLFTQEGYYRFRANGGAAPIPYWMMGHFEVTSNSFEKKFHVSSLRISLVSTPALSAPQGTHILICGLYTIDAEKLAVELKQRKEQLDSGVTMEHIVRLLGNK